MLVSSEKPWLRRHDWATGRVRAKEANPLPLVVGVVFVLGWFSVIVPTAVSVASGGARVAEYVAVGLFVPVGLFMLAVVTRHLGLAIRYGRSVFAIDLLRGVSGGTLEGAAVVPAALPEGTPVLATLTCQKLPEYAKGPTRVLWEGEQIARIERRGNESRIPVCIEIPAGCPSTQLERVPGRICWQLRLEGQGRCKGFLNTFEVPVFADDRPDAGFVRPVAGAPPPATIQLQPTAEAEWKDEAGGRQRTAQLMEQGFLDAGAYTIPAFGGIVMRGFVKPADGSVAAIYEHPVAGLVVDFVTRYPDHTSITVTSAVETGLDAPPGKMRVNMPGAEPSALYQRMVAERPPDKTPRRFAASEFAPYFEQAYAEEMTWRKGRGGLTEDEIQRVAAKSGLQLTEAEVELAQKIERNKA